ncbi:MAG TPA: hypothetical protein VL990_08130 [Acidobacteriaceae bacterium]|nr:hypothetical protein [Acidobacteriaceae bacterium]
MPTKSQKEPATETQGDFGKFSNFVRRLMAVPHSEVKAAMEADKKKRGASVSRAPGVSSKER